MCIHARSILRSLIFGAAVAALSLNYALSQCTSCTQNPAPLRAPATPLVIHDPYFSVWSMSNTLAGDATRHWTGVAQNLNGIVRVDGHNYAFLGHPDRDLPALTEASRQITPTRTVVEMSNGEIELRLTFLNPLFPDNLEQLARPVSYLTWDVRSSDGRPHDVTLYLDAGGTLATNQPGDEVVWSRAVIKGLNLLRVGTRDQRVLGRFGDDVRIDWGWFYLAVPADESAEWVAGNAADRQEFLQTGRLPPQDDLDAPRTPQSRYPPAPALSVALPLGRVGASAVSRHVLLAYDDIDSIEYMQTRLLPYWRKQFPNFAAMLESAEQDYPALAQRSLRFDAELEADLVRAGGPEYAAIATLAYGQAFAAHKLVEDTNGVPFFMPKENFSNGSISTVDVLYPSAPIFLLLNPKLVEAQLEPVLRYAETPRWKFPFAPHDLGVYPLADGQQYGGGEQTEDDQMPVEESGNILLLVDALAHAQGDAGYARRYWPLLTKWAVYLLSKGMDPENQLCTDDFAGHLAHNANLSLKAIEALGAYAQLANELGFKEQAAQYRGAAQNMAAKWVTMAKDSDHYRLAFDKPGTWSQKYNLVWDTILGLHLFPGDVRTTEVAFYLQHLGPYGLPLDNRAAYTKLDWSVWSASLAGSSQQFQTLVHPIFKFLNETPDRVPMTDWYDTVTGRMVAFRARSVVGGVYLPMLSDPAMWKKWSARAAAQAAVPPPTETSLKTKETQ
jgi:Domain of unknown function (DUF4965)/Domain of unknown function (DUF5127)/Domain of unknown function (DUF1793)/Domain of unknown function (DUF4964)